MERRYYFEYKNIDDLLDNAQWDVIIEALDEFTGQECSGVSGIHSVSYKSDCFDDIGVSTDEIIMIVENSYGDFYTDWNDRYILDYYNSVLIGFDMDKDSIIEMLEEIDYLDEFKEWVAGSYDDFIVMQAYETDYSNEEVNEMRKEIEKEVE